MSAGAIILAFIIGGGTLVFVLRPLLQRDAGAYAVRRGTPRQAQALELLWGEKQRVLREIPISILIRSGQARRARL